MPRSARAITRPAGNIPHFPNVAMSSPALPNRACQAPGCKNRAKYYNTMCGRHARRPRTPRCLCCARTFAGRTRLAICDQYGPTDTRAPRQTTYFRAVCDTCLQRNGVPLSIGIVQIDDWHRQWFDSCHRFENNGLRFTEYPGPDGYCEPMSPSYKPDQ